MTTLAATVQEFFTQRLIGQRQASPHTIAAYRDTIRLLLQFAAANHRITLSRLDLGDLDAVTITAFLDHLEQQRGNSIRTRNARLAAIHSLFHYAATRHPEQPPISAASWPSLPNAATTQSSPSSPRTRSMRCWPALTPAPAPGAATTPCSCLPSKLDYEPPS